MIPTPLKQCNVQYTYLKQVASIYNISSTPSTCLASGRPHRVRSKQHQARHLARHFQEPGPAKPSTFACGSQALFARLETRPVFSPYACFWMVPLKSTHKRKFLLGHGLRYLVCLLGFGAHRLGETSDDRRCRTFSLGSNSYFRFCGSSRPPVNNNFSPHLELA